MIVCLVVCVSSSDGIDEGAPRKRENLSLRDLKYLCELHECGHLVLDADYNCINGCISPSCYFQIYQDQPLEPGEVDSKRAKLFRSCFDQERRLHRIEDSKRVPRAAPAVYST